MPSHEQKKSHGGVPRDDERKEKETDKKEIKNTEHQMNGRSLQRNGMVIVW